MQAIGGGYASYADGTIFQMIPECLEIGRAHV